jgi:hypothetical protein
MNISDKTFEQRLAERFGTPTHDVGHREVERLSGLVAQEMLDEIHFMLREFTGRVGRHTFAHSEWPTPGVHKTDIPAEATQGDTVDWSKVPGAPRE